MSIWYNKHPSPDFCIHKHAAAPTMKKILLVEDDPDIYRLLSLHLAPPDYQLEVWDTGMDAYGQAFAHQFDLLILDVMLPDINGMEICKAVRRRDSNIPIIMLSARSGEEDKVAAFETGADDYITKPFSIKELLARVKAALRRAEQAGSGVHQKMDNVSFRDLYIDKEKKKATLHGNRLDLTPKEFDLLCLLASNPGKAFTRQQLLEDVWGIAFAGYEHTVTAHVNRLRLKIETKPASPEYILTAWGTGYRFAE